MHRCLHKSTTLQLFKNATERRVHITPSPTPSQAQQHNNFTTHAVMSPLTATAAAPNKNGQIHIMELLHPSSDARHELFYYMSTNIMCWTIPVTQLRSLPRVTIISGHKPCLGPRWRLAWRARRTARSGRTARQTGPAQCR